MADLADLGALNVYHGTDWSWQILNQDPAGNPIDMTDFGTEWTAQARVSLAAPRAIDIGVDSSQAADGLITLSLTAAQTADADNLSFDVFAGPTPIHAVYTGQLVFSGAFTHD